MRWEDLRVERNDFVAVWTRLGCFMSYQKKKRNAADYALLNYI
jgi:hypothetical protein